MQSKAGAPLGSLGSEDFVPNPFLRNPHLMTIMQAFIPRVGWVRGVKSERVLLPITKDTTLVAYASFQANRHACPTLIIVHGLEGSSQSFYVIGLAQKALAHGANVVRINLRNCGGTTHMTPTLYNAGISEDVVRVSELVASKFGLDDLFLVGYSLGGNLVLKAGAELAAGESNVSGICAVSPALDLPACVDAIEIGFNRFYEAYFLNSLKRKILEKDRHFPKRYDVSRLKLVTSLRQFDDVYTAPDAGYDGADDYYKRASSKPRLGEIKIPTYIITAQDDPLIPYSSFVDIETSYVKMLAPKHGGHAAFVQQPKKGASGVDLFWVDERVVEFCWKNSKHQRKS